MASGKSQVSFAREIDTLAGGGGSMIKVEPRGLIRDKDDNQRTSSLDTNNYSSVLLVCKHMTTNPLILPSQRKRVVESGAIGL